MTARIFVHGNPETPVIWTPLIAELGNHDATFTPHLPGFGAPSAEGFSATMDAYIDWLEATVAEIAAEHGPVDLIGHDWGGGLVVALADRRPDLLRSWVSDVIGLFHPDYVWHDFAQAWQAPGVGEETMKAMASTPMPQRVAGMNAIGMPSPQADEVLAVFDDEFARCVLALYRSAAQPVMANVGRSLEAIATRPGLAIHATEDPFGRSPTMTTEMAAKTGATIARLEGEGHWWMLTNPSAGAAALTEFWSTLD